MTKKYLSRLATITLAACVALVPLASFAQGINYTTNTNVSATVQSKPLPPVIRGISSPTVLKAGVEGTWSVTASDPQNGNLSYAIDWGDMDKNLAAVIEPAFSQTSTFTHVYAKPGVYTVKVTVKNDNGLTARSSATVNVTKGNTSAELAISDLAVKALNPTRAKVTWNTNIRSNSSVWVSTSSPVNTTADPTIYRSAKVLKHKININNLVGGTNYFVVVGSANSDGVIIKSAEASFSTPLPPNSGPTISSVDGPKSLDVGAEGTWTLNVSDPKNSNLSYMVKWGDENNKVSALKAQEEPVFVQTTTFTHAYANPGDYEISFIVKNEAGQTAEAKAKVSVNSVDESAPIISDLSIDSSATNTAKLTWMTDEDSDTQIWLSSSSSVDTTVDPTIIDAALVKNHVLAVTGLSASTTYYAVIGSRDARGNLAVSKELNFTTGIEAQAPIIGGLNAMVAGDRINLGWTTNQDADSQVFYSVNSPVVIGGASTTLVADPALVKDHMIKLTGLSAKTTYFFIIQSKNADGLVKTTAEFSLTTMPM